MNTGGGTGGAAPSSRPLPIVGKFSPVYRLVGSTCPLVLQCKGSDLPQINSAALAARVQAGDMGSPRNPRGTAQRQRDGSGGGKGWQWSCPGALAPALPVV